MMPQKNQQHCAVDQSEHELPPSCQVECSSDVALGCWKKGNSGQRNGETASSSPESDSLNGDGKRNGKSRRRRKRASNPESRPEETLQGNVKDEKPDQDNIQPADPHTVFLGLQSECTSMWFERSVYEQAENRYQCWLAHSSARATKPNGSIPAQKNHPINQPLVPPMQQTFSFGEQVAHHRVVQSVWVNKTTFDQAEWRFVEESLQPPIPNSLDLPPLPNHPITPATPDEGYQSLVPTPATPIQQAAATPPNRQPINGLPSIPVELLRDVWLEKPLYDRAEVAFYQNLYNNSSKRANCPSASRSSDHPQSLVEEEDEEDEEVVEDKQRVVPQGKAEVFHALHPIQEEEEPAEVIEERGVSEAGVSFFLHPDSERVWLDRWRHDAAESRFHGHHAGEAVIMMDGALGPDAEASTVASISPLRDNTMSAVDFLAQEKIWFEKPRYDEAERCFYEHMNGPSPSTQDVGANSILQDIARARENIQKSLAGLKTTLFNRGSGHSPLSHSSQLSGSSGAGDQGELVSRIKNLELENQSLHKVVEDLRSALSKLECRVAVLEKSPVAALTPAPVSATPCTNGTPAQQQMTGALLQEDDVDDDFDLFGSDEEDPEAERLKEQRLKEYAERKAKKPALIAKSSILLDVKPWDDETDMVKLEECVRSVQADGLLWGTSKLVPVGYGIKKLQIACVVEDDKVGTDMLEEEITKFEDYVQSVDVAAFNKI
ncbi:uncharacterized protein LOC130109818 [Lampris incognitus]|uniref:uncharacterized protein LOC130109818 n=1 Tax=Lampris incognitus TaxID=2546036 RepID=UPI0024B634D2|nr:uncharacterized protein LOC130109818 [Lampris incognitus]